MRVTVARDPEMENSAFSRFVPPPAQELLQYKALSKAVVGARERLSAAQATGDPAKITRAWDDHDNVVLEARLVSLSMERVVADGGAAVMATRERISRIIAAKMIDDTSDLGKALAACAACEHALSALYVDTVRQQHVTDATVHNARRVGAAYDALERALRVVGAEMRDAVRLETGHPLARAWTEHGFSSAGMIDSHGAGQIPDRMRCFFSRQTMGALDPAAMVLDEQVWREFNYTPLGVQLGFLARYACRDGPHLDATLVLEQLCTYQRKLSLLLPDVLDGLLNSIQTKPCASLPRNPDAAVPLCLILLQLADTDAIWKDTVTAAVKRYRTEDVLGLAEKCVCAASDKPAGTAIPTIKCVMRIAMLFNTLIEQLSEDPRKPDDIARPLHPRRGLLAIATLLWDMRKDPMRALVARLLVWWRYIVRPEHVERHKFWEWEFALSTLTSDLRAFVGSSSIFGSQTWTFDLNAAS